MYLLTDSYPPFSLDDEDYPARPILPAPGRLNRWAVLFRLVLAIPAAVFSQIVQYGLTFPILLVMWFVVLVSGRMPPSLYTTYAALLRYQVRFHSYFLMLTSVYAWGMLGDPPAAPVPTFGAPPFAAPPFAAPPPPTAFAGTPPPSAMPPGTPPSGMPPSGPPPSGMPPPPTGAPQDSPVYRTPPAQPYSYPSVGAGTTRTPSDEVTPGDRTEPETTPVSDDARAPGPGPGPAPEPAEPTPAPAPPQWPPPVPPPPPPVPPPPAGLGGMPPPSPWERVAPTLPADEQTPAWATLVLAGAARGWMIFAIVWGSIVFLGQNITQNVFTGHRHSSSTQLDRVDRSTALADAGTGGVRPSMHESATVWFLRPASITVATTMDVATSEADQDQG